MSEDFTHESASVPEAMSEAVWCARGLWYHATTPLRIIPGCRFGWHRWCSCCSPVFCTRCGVEGHD